MKIELREFKLLDYFRFLFLTLNKNYKNELHENTLGYLSKQIISFLKGEKVYKFVILVNKKFAGSVVLYKRYDYYEVGCFVLKNFRKKGIAKKATKQILNFAFNNLNLKKILAVTSIKNKVSQKILRDLKFKKIRTNKKDKEFIWESEK
jgi:RimJ/RimL family protein N-acetyltransferase